MAWKRGRGSRRHAAHGHSIGGTCKPGSYWKRTTGLLQEEVCRTGDSTAEPRPQSGRRILWRRRLLQTVRIRQPFRRQARLIRTDHLMSEESAIQHPVTPVRHRTAPWPQGTRPGRHKAGCLACSCDRDTRWAPDLTVSRPPSAVTGPVPRWSASCPPPARTASIRDHRAVLAPKIPSPCMRRHWKHIAVRHGFPCGRLPGIDSAATDSQSQAIPWGQGATSPNSGFRGFGRIAHGVREPEGTGRCPNERDQGLDRRPDRAAQAAKGRPLAQEASDPARRFGLALGFGRFAMKGRGRFPAVCPEFGAPGAAEVSSVHQGGRRCPGVPLPRAGLPPVRSATVRHKPFSRGRPVAPEHLRSAPGSRCSPHATSRRWRFRRLSPSVP